MSSIGIKRALASAAAIAASLALAACGGGGSSGPTKAETASEAAGLCAAANTKAAKDSVEFTNDNPVVFLAAVESRHDIVKPMYASMKEIDPSEDARGQWDAFLAAQGKAIAAMDQFKAFVESKPTGGGDATRAQFQQQSREVLDAGDAVADAAAAYGAHQCVQGPYVQTPGYEPPAATGNTGATGGGGATKHFTSATLGSFDYPAGWHEKDVTGESASSAVAFGDDSADCAVIVSRRGAPGGRQDDGQAAATYARGQARTARAGADSYSLIKLGPVQAGNVAGAQIVRRFTIDGKQEAGNIAFFFDSGKRFVVDCKTAAVGDFNEINATQFEPLIAGYSVPPTKPK